MISETIALSVKQVSISYPTARGWVQAVRDVSLQVKQGQLVGLAGESGSGKSTLALAVTRVLKPPTVRITGDVTIAGRDVFSLSARELRAARWKTFSFVTQSAMNALNPVMRIRHQMHDAVRAHDPQYTKMKTDKRCEEVFRIVEVPIIKLDSYPHQLSGGQRQRVVIALALLLQPELIIMDEPTTALDVVAQRGIIALIRKLQREFGFAVLLITHDLSLLLEVADEVVVMYGGRVMESGPSLELLNGARHPYSRALIQSFPSLHGAMTRHEGIPGTPPDMLNPPPGCPFADRCTLTEDICRQEIPALLARENRAVACHMVERVTANGGVIT